MAEGEARSATASAPTAGSGSGLRSFSPHTDPYAGGCSLRADGTTLRPLTSCSGWYRRDLWQSPPRDQRENGATHVSDAASLLRQYLIAGDRADYASLRRLLHADVATHSPGDLTIHGIDGQVAAWDLAHRGLEALDHDVQTVLACRDAAAARVRVRGTHSGRFLGVEPTGGRIEVDQALFVRVEASLIVEMWEVVDTGSGLRQLGVLGSQSLSPGEEPPAS